MGKIQVEAELKRWHAGQSVSEEGQLNLADLGIKESVVLPTTQLMRDKPTPVLDLDTSQISEDQRNKLQ